MSEMYCDLFILKALTCKIPSILLHWIFSICQALWKTFLFLCKWIYIRVSVYNIFPELGLYHWQLRGDIYIAFRCQVAIFNKAGCSHIYIFFGIRICKMVGYLALHSVNDWNLGINELAKTFFIILHLSD